MNYILLNDAWVGMAMFSYGYIKTDFASHAAVFAFHILFMQPLLYNVEDDTNSNSNLLARYLFLMLNVALNILMVQILYSWVGYLYLDTKLLQQSYTRLLNNMKEGIFVFDKSSNKLSFTNEFAQRMQAKLSDQCSISLS